MRTLYSSPRHVLYICTTLPVTSSSYQSDGHNIMLPSVPPSTTTTKTPNPQNPSAPNIDPTSFPPRYPRPPITAILVSYWSFHYPTAIPTTSNTPSLTPPPQSINQSTAPANTLPPPLPYHVHRTASQQLPIYQLAKRGGNLHQTRIRKIEGDVEKLKDEVTRALGIREDLVVINRLTGHIVIKVRQRNVCGACWESR